MVRKIAVTQVNINTVFISVKVFFLLLYFDKQQTFMQLGLL